VERLIRSQSDISLIVDVNWQQHYRGRDQHPISEAELVKVDNGQVAKIGKGVVSPEEARGEFIGLARFTRAGAETMKAAYHQAATEHPTAPFHQAASLEKAYLTDMFQELVDTGSVVKSADIEGGWMEVDTPQDLAEASRWLSNNT
jgi:choline kinase